MLEPKECSAQLKHHSVNPLFEHPYRQDWRPASSAWTTTDPQPTILPSSATIPPSSIITAFQRRSRCYPNQTTSRPPVRMQPLPIRSSRSSRKRIPPQIDSLPPRRLLAWLYLGQRQSRSKMACKLASISEQHDPAGFSYGPQSDSYTVSALVPFHDVN